jgi:hypothetical protein
VAHARILQRRDQHSRIAQVLHRDVDHAEQHLRLGLHVRASEECRLVVRADREEAGIERVRELGLEADDLRPRVLNECGSVRHCDPRMMAYSACYDVSSTTQQVFVSDDPQQSYQYCGQKERNPRESRLAV